MNKRKLFSFLTSILLTYGFAEAQDLATFLAGVKNNPAVKAQESLVAAAQAQLEAAYSPVSATVQGNYATGSYSLERDVIEDNNLPEQSFGFSIGATFRPFVFGDLADLAEQRRIALEQAKLTYQQTLADLEVQALEAAANLQLAQTSLVLARAGQDIAQAALDSTQLRFERGAASEAELRAAQERLRNSENQIQNAEAGVALAQQGVQLLVGEASPDVRQAEFNILLAKLGIGSSNRSFIPTAQASVVLPLNDDKSEIDFSIESRTLQPTVTYKYDNPKQSIGQGFPVPRDNNPLDGDLDLGAGDVSVALSVGVSATISVEQFNNLDAANAQLAAAQAGLVGAQDRANLTALTLSNSYQTAVRGLELAKLTLSNAESTLAETRAREEAGLAVPLETDQATLVVEQAKLSVFTAEIDVLKAILSTYRTYAQPVSETLEPASSPSEESQ
jgi:outer membrane protein TolC